MKTKELGPIGGKAGGGIGGVERPLDPPMVLLINTKAPN